MAQTPYRPQGKVGVLLVNLGTPDAPTVPAVRRYLAEFLWDPRVVEIPRVPWWFVLHGLILRSRPRKSAKAYASIWTERGSPLLTLTTELGNAVETELHSNGLDHVRLRIAMRYGRPSIREQLEKLRADGIEHLIVIPLFPQYAAATAATVFDAVTKVLRDWRHIPHFDFIGEYHREEAYIAAVGATVAESWRDTAPADLLLFSFHGLPERCRSLGDPYYEHCLETAGMIAQRLGLEESRWRVAFQSRFGPAQWLKPYCVDVLKELPAAGIRKVDVVCPGFAVDCLETLEEIAITNREVFMQAGGEHYRYIPALNSRDEHVRMLAALVRRKLGAGQPARFG